MAPSSGIALLPSYYPRSSGWLRHRNKSKALNPKTDIISIVAAVAIVGEAIVA
ncbi:MAG TPA: hypothetical protein VIG72_06125 [Pontibacter sp.]